MGSLFFFLNHFLLLGGSVHIMVLMGSVRFTQCMATRLRARRVSFLVGWTIHSIFLLKYWQKIKIRVRILTKSDSLNLVWTTDGEHELGSGPNCYIIVLVSLFYIY